MGFFGKKKEGGIMDVIRCDEPEYIVWKWRPSGEANSTRKENAIRYGTTIRVKTGEIAILVYKQKNGETMDVLVGPYDGTIKTANLPVLTGLVGALYGGDSPFQAEIYFINLSGNNKVKFAIPYFDLADPRFLDFTIPVTVRGSILFNLTDYENFLKLNRLIDFNLEEFSNQIKSTVTRYTKQLISNCPFQYNIPIFQLNRKTDEISGMLEETLGSIFERDFGVNLKRLDLDAIELDEESERYKEFCRLTREQQMKRSEIDTKTYEMGQRLSTETAHLQAHIIDQQTDILKTAAENLGQMSAMNLGGGGDGGMNPAGMMMGMAMGGAMGSQMSGMMQNMNNAMQQPNIQQPPPPVQNTIMYHISSNGAQSGPYTIQQLQQLAQSGQLTANTYVWKPGMANWDLAGNVPEISMIFMSNTPPPPPPLP